MARCPRLWLSTHWMPWCLFKCFNSSEFNSQGSQKTRIWRPADRTAPGSQRQLVGEIYIRQFECFRSRAPITPECAVSAAQQNLVLAALHECSNLCRIHALHNHIDKPEGVHFLEVPGQLLVSNKYSGIFSSSFICDDLSNDNF